LGTFDALVCDCFHTRLEWNFSQFKSGKAVWADVVELPEKLIRGGDAVVRSFVFCARRSLISGWVMRHCNVP
jgi:hypothetical protein